MPDLPDEAFAYIEPGGTQDDEKKTFPRASRHFAHHDEDGNVDPELLAVAILEAKSSKHGQHALSHLLRHEAAAELDEAHTKYWAATSSAGQLLVIADELERLTTTVVNDQKAMDLLGYSTVAERIRPEPLQRLEELKQWLAVVIDHAKQAETGDDGTARAEYLRRRLALLEV